MSASAAPARPEEVETVIAFLTSEDTSFLAGQVLVADSGWGVAPHPPQES